MACGKGWHGLAARRFQFICSILITFIDTEEANDIHNTCVWESTQWVTINGVLQMLECDVVLDSVRNSRYCNWYPAPLKCAVDDWVNQLNNESVVLTQTHPVAPYVCRTSTGNITLRCQYESVEGASTVLWSIGKETTTTNPSTIPGHTAPSFTPPQIRRWW